MWIVIPHSLHFLTLKALKKVQSPGWEMITMEEVYVLERVRAWCFGAVLHHLFKREDDEMPSYWLPSLSSLKWCLKFDTMTMVMALMWHRWWEQWSYECVGGPSFYQASCLMSHNWETQVLMILLKLYRVKFVDLIT